MAPTDVVRKNIHVPPSFDFTGPVEPMPMPILKSAPPFPSVNPPVDQVIDPLVIDDPPYRSVGKMAKKYFPDAPVVGGSGWVVAPRAFITAGHCVYWQEYSGWVYEATFCPRFSLTCPGKTYVVEAVFTLRGWLDDATDTGDRRYDIGACLVTEAFGQEEPPLRFDTSPAPVAKFAALGYPGKEIPNRKFNGKHMWESVGNSLGIQQGLHFAQNDFTEGSSGGPWCDPANKWVVKGLTVARTNDPNAAMSPVLGPGFQNIYDAVKNL